MRDLLKKAKKRVADAKHVDAKQAMLHTVFPLFEEVLRMYEGMAENVDHNFEDIYSVLEIAKDNVFLDNTEDFIARLTAFNDKTMVAAGFLAPNPDGEGFLPTDTLPDELKVEMAELMRLGLSWFQQLEAMRAAADNLVDDDDDDDDDEDEDDDEDDDENENDDGPVIDPSNAPTQDGEPEPDEPVIEPVAKAKNDSEVTNAPA